MTEVRPCSRCISLQQVVQVLGRVLVEIAGRLVGQEERRPHHERAGDRDALLLAARQHARPVLEALGEADALEQARGALAALGGRLARDAQRHLGVLDRAELRQQVVELEHEPHVLVAERDHRLVREAAELDLVDADRARVGRVEPAQDVQQRALADARRSDDGHHLAALEREIEILEHGQARAADGVALREAGDVDERHSSASAVSFSCQLPARSRTARL